MHGVRYKRVALRDIRRLSRSVQLKIEETVVKVSEAPYASGKKLQGSLRHLRSARVNHRAHTYALLMKSLRTSLSLKS